MINPGKCYFVTGGTGFIGQRLVQRLAAEGNRVHVLSRDPGKSTLFPQPEVHFFTGDILDIDSFKDAMQGCNGVYHLAAYARSWPENEKIFFDYNVQGTQNVLQAAKELGAGRVVFCSTAGILSPASESPANENTPRNIPFFTPYEKSKYRAEQLIKETVQRGQDAVIVNPSRLFGPGALNESNSVTKIIHKYMQSKWHILPGNGKRYGNYVFVDDVAEGLILAMKKGRSGERYILGGTDLTYSRFFQELAAVTGKNNILIPLPLFFMQFIVFLMMVLYRLFHIRPLITHEWLKKYLYDWKLSSEKATRELGYQPSSFPDALRKTLLYLQTGT